MKSRLDYCWHKPMRSRTAGKGRRARGAAVLGRSFDQRVRGDKVLVFCYATERDTRGN